MAIQSDYGKIDRHFLPTRPFQTDIILFNIGAWFHSFDDFNSTLERYYRQYFQTFDGILIGRQYSPVHFKTVGSEFEDPKIEVDEKCPPSSYSKFQKSKMSFRLNYFDKWCEKKMIPIINVFNVSVERVEQKTGTPKGDFGQWCSSSSVLSMWNTMFLNELKNYF